MNIKRRMRRRPVREPLRLARVTQNTSKERCSGVDKIWSPNSIPLGHNVGHEGEAGFEDEH